jgi:hypothetical protein
MLRARQYGCKATNLNNGTLASNKNGDCQAAIAIFITHSMRTITGFVPQPERLWFWKHIQAILVLSGSTDEDPAR